MGDGVDVLNELGGVLRAEGIGVLRLFGGVFRNALGGEIQIISMLDVNSGATLQNKLGGLISGNGTLNFTPPSGQLLNEGTIAPGESVGCLDLIGNYSQAASGSLEIEIDNSGSDTLLITGNAILDGILHVELINGFVPSPADEFTILEANQITGAFDNVFDGQVVFANGSFEVIADINSITLTNYQAILLGDVNGDGVVSLLDVAPFVALVTSGGFQVEADINGDGVVSLLDVAPFVELLTGG